MSGKAIAILAGAALALWLLLRPRKAAADPAPQIEPPPEGNVEVGPLLLGPYLDPRSSPGPYLVPDLIVPFEVYRENPGVYASPTGLQPDQELEALNRYRYPIQ